MRLIFVLGATMTCFATSSLAGDSRPKPDAQTKAQLAPNPALDVKAPPPSKESTGVSGSAEVPKGQATDPRSKPKTMDPGKQM